MVTDISAHLRTIIYNSEDDSTYQDKSTSNKCREEEIVESKLFFINHAKSLI